MDKQPSLRAVVAISLAAAAAGWWLSKRAPVWALLTLTGWGAFFALVVAELEDPAVGPAVAREQPGYGPTVWLCGISVVVVHAVVLRRRCRDR